MLVYPTSGFETYREVLKGFPREQFIVYGGIFPKLFPMLRQPVEKMTNGIRFQSTQIASIAHLFLESRIDLLFEQPPHGQRQIGFMLVKGFRDHGITGGGHDRIAGCRSWVYHRSHRR